MLPGLLLLAVVGSSRGASEPAECVDRRAVVGRRCAAETPLPAGLFWTDGDRSAPYPACCRRRTRGCWRQDVRRWAAPGEQWTGPDCTQVRCDAGALVSQSCGEISLPPGQQCRIEEGDRSAAYPHCCPTVNCTSCWAPELGRSVAVGESWTLKGCSGLATCSGLEKVGAVGCPLQAVSPGVPCALDDGDPQSDDYPRCCPKITCPDCYSKQLQRFFGPGDSWTEAYCVKKLCELYPNKTVAVVDMQCPSLTPSPEWNCTRVDGGDPNIGFPDCCPGYKCPKHCLVYSKSVWRFVDVGSQWTDDDSCTLSRCALGGRVIKLPCEPLGPAPGPDCYVVRGDHQERFPSCCPFYKCRPTCYSAVHNRHFKIGEEWTVGNGCSKLTCVADEFGHSQIEPVGPPCKVPGPQPGCYIQEGNNDADYPGCCPRLNCSGCWVSTLGRAISVGQSWTMGRCSVATCRERGFSGKGCGLMAVLPHTPCMLGSSQPGVEYPRCCPRITCPDCFSKRLNRYFGPDNVWTEAGCVRKQCVYESDGYVNVQEEDCSSRPEPPDEDCVLLEGNDDGDFPSCCPRYQCPKHCFSESDGRFYAVGEVWTEPGSCVQARCVAGGNGDVGVVRVQCRTPKAPETLSNCRIISDPTANFPGCCPYHECRESTAN